MMLIYPLPNYTKKTMLDKANILYYIYLLRWSYHIIYLKFKEDLNL